MANPSASQIQRDNGKTDVSLIKTSIANKLLVRESGAKIKPVTLGLTGQHEQDRKLNELMETKSRFISMSYTEYRHPLKVKSTSTEIFWKRLDMGAMKQSLLNRIKSILF